MFFVSNVEHSNGTLLTMNTQEQQSKITRLTLAPQPQPVEHKPGEPDWIPPLFRLVLESFTITAQTGEPTGAAYQGVVFGFLRANNPHLQVEIDMVRTRSTRLQRVGDIDCWEGSRLAISAKVKQLTLRTNAVPDLEGFAHETGKRGTLGMVIALAYADGVRDDIEALGLKALDRHDLLHIVELWDPLKQRTAVQSFIYYAQHVEKNSSLSDRLQDFLAQAENAAKTVHTTANPVPIEKPTPPGTTKNKKQ